MIYKLKTALIKKEKKHRLSKGYNFKYFEKLWREYENKCVAFWKMRREKLFEKKIDLDIRGHSEEHFGNK